VCTEAATQGSPLNLYEQFLRAANWYFLLVIMGLRHIAAHPEACTLLFLSFPAFPVCVSIFGHALLDSCWRGAGGAGPSLNWVLELFGREMAMLPLLFVLASNAVKEFYADVLRRRFPSYDPSPPPRFRSVGISAVVSRLFGLFFPAMKLMSAL
jgi:hypothetical protein